MSIIHLYLLLYFPPTSSLPPEAGKALRAIPLCDRLPTTWANSLSFSIKKFKNGQTDGQTHKKQTEKHKRHGQKHGHKHTDKRYKQTEKRTYKQHTDI